MLPTPSADGHIHTEMCRHATGTMEQYVLSAMEKGLQHICFLEHMEEGIDSPRLTWLDDEQFAAYFAEGRRLRRLYGRQISIGLGVEVGYNPERVDVLRQRLARHHWDSIGISYHFYRRRPGEQHLNLVSKREPRLQDLSLDEAAAIEADYYSTLRQAVEQLPGTVLCHIDAVLRYYPERNELVPPWRLIDDLLEAVRNRGLALEVNTSGVGVRGEVFPARAIRELAQAKGIALAWGSDAHRPEDVGNHFELRPE